MDGNYVLFVGGPDSGKTNYIARLWLAIKDGSCQLSSTYPPDDVAYLEELTDYLLRGQFSPRTQREFFTKPIINVEYFRGHEKFSGSLYFPDCHGEEWEKIYKRREWSRRWEDIISHTAGVLLFLRVGSEQIVTPLDWISCYNAFGILPCPLEGNAEYDGEHPTQVLAVDWIQALQKSFNEYYSTKLRVGIILSAWDLVPVDQIATDPILYLKDNFPLLFQYIISNNDTFDFKVYGLSIAGGDLREDGECRNSFLENPHSAGYVFYNNGSEVTKYDDVTIPIVWALGLK